jgi:hypothetical protein
MTELVVPQLRLPRGAVLSHASAARLWGLPLPYELDEQIHVSLPACRSRWAATPAVVHRRHLPAADCADLAGRALTTPLRTVLDLASVWGLADAVAAADFALHCGRVSSAELQQAALAVHGPGAVQARRLITLVDPAAESPLESAFRVTLAVRGVRPPESQYELRDGGLFVARLDFAWPEDRVAALTDGFGFHADRDSYRRDRELANELERLRWRLLIFTWEQVMFRPDYVIALVEETLEPVPSLH